MQKTDGITIRFLYFILLPESTELSYAQTEDVVKIAKTNAASMVVFMTFSQIYL